MEDAEMDKAWAKVVGAMSALYAKGGLSGWKRKAAINKQRTITTLLAELDYAPAVRAKQRRDKREKEGEDRPKEPKERSYAQKQLRICRHWQEALLTGSAEKKARELNFAFHEETKIGPKPEGYVARHTPRFAKIVPSLAVPEFTWAFYRSIGCRQCNNKRAGFYDMWGKKVKFIKLLAKRDRTGVMAVSEGARIVCRDCAIADRNARGARLATADVSYWLQHGLPASFNLVEVKHASYLPEDGKFTITATVDDNGPFGKRKDVIVKVWINGRTPIMVDA